MSKQRRTVFMVTGSAALALAPKCPFCLLAYFGILGVATTLVSMYRVWLLPMTAVWLALTVAILAFRRGHQQLYGPVTLGVFAGLSVFVGKFIVNDLTLVYAGLAALLGAAVWRSLILKPTLSESCFHCEQLPLLDNREPCLKRPAEVSTYKNR